MSKIILISNWFKDMFDNLVNNINDDSNTKTLARSKKIYISSNDILNPGKKKKDLNEEKNLL